MGMVVAKNILKVLRCNCKGIANQCRTIVPAEKIVWLASQYVENAMVRNVKIKRLE